MRGGDIGTTETRHGPWGFGERGDIEDGVERVAEGEERKGTGKRG